MAAERRKKARTETTAGGDDNVRDRRASAFEYLVTTLVAQIPEDPLGRPMEKIMLLSGPPGLGKTTLAHVLARQAGYQVHEINASFVNVLDQLYAELRRHCARTEMTEVPKSLLIGSAMHSNHGL